MDTDSVTSDDTYVTAHTGETPDPSPVSTPGSTPAPTPVPSLNPTPVPSPVPSPAPTPNPTPVPSARSSISSIQPLHEPSPPLEDLITSRPFNRLNFCLKRCCISCAGCLLLYLLVLLIIWSVTKLTHPGIKPPLENDHPIDGLPRMGIINYDDWYSWEKIFLGVAAAPGPMPYLGAGITFRSSPALQKLVGARIFNFKVITDKDFWYGGEIFYLEHAEGQDEDDPKKKIRIGLSYFRLEVKRHIGWSEDPEETYKIMFTQLKGDNRPVVVNAHGMGRTRRGSKTWASSTGYVSFPHHLLNFDYRGNADSSEALPTMPGFTEDLLLIYRWLIFTVKVSPERILFWGHSLGTAVVLRGLEAITKSNGTLPQPIGAVLLNPPVSLKKAFKRMKNREVELLVKIPFLSYFFLSPLQNNPLFGWHSGKAMRSVQVPVFIAHTPGDKVVSFDQGVQLYGEAKKWLPPSDANKSIFYDYSTDRQLRPNATDHEIMSVDLVIHVRTFLEGLCKKPKCTL